LNNSSHYARLQPPPPPPPAATPHNQQGGAGPEGNESPAFQDDINLCVSSDIAQVLGGVGLSLAFFYLHATMATSMVAPASPFSLSFRAVSPGSFCQCGEW